MTTREDFEKWMLDCYGIDVLKDRAGEGYIYDQINDKWIGYEACAAHYKSELLKRDALIAEKDKALQFYANYDHMTKIKPWHESDNASEERKKSGFVHVTTCNDDEEIWVENGTAAEKALSLTHDKVRITND